MRGPSIWAREFPGPRRGRGGASEPVREPVAALARANAGVCAVCRRSCVCVRGGGGGREREGGRETGTETETEMETETEIETGTETGTGTETETETETETGKDKQRDPASASFISSDAHKILGLRYNTILHNMI